MAEKDKKKMWVKPVIYAALAIPSALLLLNEEGNYVFFNTSIPSFPLVILCAFAAYLFNENFISKDLVKPKTAQVGPKAPLSARGDYREELDMKDGEFRPPRDFSGPRF